jgi:RNA polymerase sigma factor (sigma-70 family)
MATSIGNLTDGQLLDRFANRRDEEAFAQLVHRHGPLVLGVCRQMLRQEQDAEDAFQATFLVLSRKAGSIRRAEALPNWLYGVATRLATRMKAAALRRQRREVALVERPPSDPAPEGEGGELSHILYEEIGRLPDKYRVPFVLCYLEGKTNEQTAQHLGCPHGTVFSRLARARERLRLRLKRRGLVISSAALAATHLSLSQQASAAVPESLEAITTERALRFGSGNLGGVSDIPHRVTSLATSGVRSLASPKLRMAGLLMLVALAALVLGLVLRPRPVDDSINERLQGTWDATAVNIRGFQVPGRPASQVTFDGTQMTLAGTSGSYRIDAAKDPMHLDWIVQGMATRGIFKVDRDELTLCFMEAPDAPAGNPLPRPTDFSPQPGKIITVFKRQQHSDADFDGTSRNH